MSLATAESDATGVEAVFVVARVSSLRHDIATKLLLVTEWRWLARKMQAFDNIRLARVKKSLISGIKTGLA